MGITKKLRRTEYMKVIEMVLRPIRTYINYVVDLGKVAPSPSPRSLLRTQGMEEVIVPYFKGARGVGEIIPVASQHPFHLAMSFTPDYARVL